MGVNFDITERKKAEEAVAAAQRQIQGIIDNSTSIIYALDQEERFLLANTALARLLNSTPERMIGKRRHEFMPKDDADWHEANDRQVIEAGKALEFEEYSRLKGRTITWLTTKFPLHDAQGRIYAIAGISADVSERKQAEEMLRESEKKFRTLFECAYDAIIVTDPTGGGRITSVNPAACHMFGYSEEEFLNMNLARETIVDASATNLAAFLKDRDEKGWAASELIYKRKDGTCFAGDVSSAFYSDRNGNRLAVAIIRDISASGVKRK
jgi:PAS domain S-box-containing protein